MSNDKSSRKSYPDQTINKARDLRENNRLRVKEIAELLEVPPSTVKKWLLYQRRAIVRPSYA